MKPELSNKQIQIQKLQDELYETEDRIEMYRNNKSMYSKLLYKRNMINKKIRSLEKTD